MNSPMHCPPRYSNFIEHLVGSSCAPDWGYLDWTIPLFGAFVEVFSPAIKVLSTCECVCQRSCRTMFGLGGIFCPCYLIACAS